MSIPWVLILVGVACLFLVLAQNIRRTSWWFGPIVSLAQIFGLVFIVLTILNSIASSNRARRGVA